MAGRVADLCFDPSAVGTAGCGSWAGAQLGRPWTAQRSQDRARSEVFPGEVSPCGCPGCPGDVRACSCLPLGHGGASPRARYCKRRATVRFAGFHWSHVSAVWTFSCV